MATPELKHLRLSTVDEVTLIEITTRDFRSPEASMELSSELRRVGGQEWAKCLLIDCQRLRFLCSTAFAGLVKLVTWSISAGKQVRFCSMPPEVRLGAEIIGLDKLAPIDVDEATALAAFAVGAE
jgi:anti-anti-sigma regulatory factor